LSSNNNTRDDELELQGGEWSSRKGVISYSREKTEKNVDLCSVLTKKPYHYLNGEAADALAITARSEAEAYYISRNRLSL